MNHATNGKKKTFKSLFDFCDPPSVLALFSEKHQTQNGSALDKAEQWLVEIWATSRNIAGHPTLINKQNPLPIKMYIISSKLRFASILSSFFLSC